MKSLSKQHGISEFARAFLFLLFNVLSASVGKENTDDLSAISFTLCEDFTENVSFKIKVTTKDRQGQKGKTLSPRFKATTHQKNLDPLQIANKFCEYLFTDAGPSLANKLLDSGISHEMFLQNRIFETIFLKPVAANELVDLQTVSNLVRRASLIKLKLMTLHATSIS